MKTGYITNVSNLRVQEQAKIVLNFSERTEVYLFRLYGNHKQYLIEDEKGKLIVSADNKGPFFKTLFGFGDWCFFDDIGNEVFRWERKNSKIFYGNKRYDITESMQGQIKFQTDEFQIHKSAEGLGFDFQYVEGFLLPCLCYSVLLWNTYYDAIAS